MGKEIPLWWWYSSISQGQSRWQSFVHLSLMLDLVAKAILYLEHIKIKSNQIKSNLGSVAQEEVRQRALFHHAFQVQVGKDIPIPALCPTVWAQVGQNHTESCFPSPSTA